MTKACKSDNEFHSKKCDKSQRKLLKELLVGKGWMKMTFLITIIWYSLLTVVVSDTVPLVKENSLGNEAKDVSWSSYGPYKRLHDKINESTNTSDIQRSTQCQNADEVVRLLANILRVLLENLNDDTTKAETVNQVFDTANSYLREAPSLQTKELAEQFQAAERYFENNTRRTLQNNKGNVKIVFKYDLPNITQPECKDAFMKLVAVAHNAYMDKAQYPLCKEPENANNLLMRSRPDEEMNMQTLPSNASDDPNAPYQLVFQNKPGGKYNNSVVKREGDNQVLSLLQSYRPGNVIELPLNQTEQSSNHTSELYNQQQVQKHHITRIKANSEIPNINPVAGQVLNSAEDEFSTNLDHAKKLAENLRKGGPQNYWLYSGMVPQPDVQSSVNVYNSLIENNPNKPLISGVLTQYQNANGFPNQAQIGQGSNGVQIQQNKNFLNHLTKQAQHQQILNPGPYGANPWVLYNQEITSPLHLPNNISYQAKQSNQGQIYVPNGSTVNQAEQIGKQMQQNNGISNYYSQIPNYQGTENGPLVSGNKGHGVLSLHQNQKIDGHPTQYKEKFGFGTPVPPIYEGATDSSTQTNKPNTLLHQVAHSTYQKQVHSFVVHPTYSQQEDNLSPEQNQNYKNYEILNRQPKVQPQNGFIQRSPQVDSINNLEPQNRNQINPYFQPEESGLEVINHNTPNRYYTHPQFDNIPSGLPNGYNKYTLIDKNPQNQYNFSSQNHNNVNSEKAYPQQFGYTSNLEPTDINQINPYYNSKQMSGGQGVLNYNAPNNYVTQQFGNNPNDLSNAHILMDKGPQNPNENNISSQNSNNINSENTYPQLNLESQNFNENPYFQQKNHSSLEVLNYNTPNNYFTQSDNQSNIPNVNNNLYPSDQNSKNMNNFWQQIPNYVNPENFNQNQYNNNAKNNANNFITEDISKPKSPVSSSDNANQSPLVENPYPYMNPFAYDVSTNPTIVPPAPFSRPENSDSNLINNDATNNLIVKPYEFVSSNSLPDYTKPVVNQQDNPEIPPYLPLGGKLSPLPEDMEDYSGGQLDNSVNVPSFPNVPFALDKKQGNKMYFGNNGGQFSTNLGPKAQFQQTYNDVAYDNPSSQFLPNLDIAGPHQYQPFQNQQGYTGSTIFGQSRRPGPLAYNQILYPQKNLCPYQFPNRFRTLQLISLANMLMPKCIHSNQILSGITPNGPYSMNPYLQNSNVLYYLKNTYCPLLMSNQIYTFGSSLQGVPNPLLNLHKHYCQIIMNLNLNTFQPMQNMPTYISQDESKIPNIDERIKPLIQQQNNNPYQYRNIPPRKQLNNSPLINYYIAQKENNPSQINELSNSNAFSYNPSSNLQTSSKLTYDQSPAATNPAKLDYTPSTPDIIEITYLLKGYKRLPNQEPFYIKYKIPYEVFLTNFKSLLLRDSTVRNNPDELYKELVPNSVITDLSPNLKGIPKEDLLKLVARVGSYVGSEVLKQNDTKPKSQLRYAEDQEHKVKIEKTIRALDIIVNSQNIENKHASKQDQVDAIKDKNVNGIDNLSNYNNNQVIKQYDTVAESEQSKPIVDQKFRNNYLKPKDDSLNENKLIESFPIDQADISRRVNSNDNSPDGVKESSTIAITVASKEKVGLSVSESPQNVSVTV